MDISSIILDKTVKIWEEINNIFQNNTILVHLESRKSIILLNDTNILEDMMESNYGI